MRYWNGGIIAAVILAVTILASDSMLGQGPFSRRGGPRGPQRNQFDHKPAGELDPNVDEKTYVMVLDVEIKTPESMRGWHPPFVAVWLQDKDDYPVRTLALWIQTDGSGPRWHRDLRRWYRMDQDRKRDDPLDLIETISGATRPAGTYKVAWDGTDDHGKPLAAGKYTFLVEAVREHGGYTIIKDSIEIGPEAFKKELAGNAEIQSVKIDFRGVKKN